jgi:hypothetical protein
VTCGSITCAKYFSVVPLPINAYLARICASISYHLAYLFAYLQPTMAPNASDRSKKRAAAGAEVAELPAREPDSSTIAASNLATAILARVDPY